MAFLANSTRDSLSRYGLGLQVLALSLQQHAPAYPRYLMVHPGLRDQLVPGWTTCQTQPIIPLHRTGVNRWRDTFTKLSIFGLVQFERVLFLDCDTLVRPSPQTTATPTI